MRTVRSSRADVVVSTILVLILATFTIAQVNLAEETANRVKCASNLRQMGQAMLLYSNENRGVYPRTTFDVVKPVPTWATPYAANPKLGPVKLADPFDPKKSEVAVSSNDVTAALFLLLRTQDIDGVVFTCPSTGNQPWDYGGKQNSPRNWSNWPSNKVIADHLSYSYQNPYPTKQAIGAGFRLNNALGADFAVAADINPGIDALTKVPLSAGEDEVRIGNSPNHGGDGQNVLYGDGHVEFQGSPYVGATRDNIYTFGNSGPTHKDAAGDGIVGAPVGPHDSILLPTAKDVGLVDANGKLREDATKRRMGVSADLKPATPQQQAELRKQIVGNYSQVVGGTKVKLQITEDKLIGNSGPMTITYGYTIGGFAEGGMAGQLLLTAPDTPESAARIIVDADGVTIKGSFLEGKWTKQR